MTLIHTGSDLIYTHMYMHLMIFPRVRLLNDQCPIDIVACTQIHDAKLMGRYLEYS